jgi:glycosyltransferase involved in cell wall biosynthesis
LSDVCRVALLTDTPAFGGAEVYLTTLARRLADRYRFTAIVGDGAPEELGRRLSCPVEVIPGLRRRPHARPLAHIVGALRRLHPDLVHLNLTDQGDGLTLVAAAGLVRRPAVATLHDVIPGRHRAKERVSKWALRRCHVVIAPSRALAASVTAAGAAATVIGHGLDFPKPDRDAARAALGLAPDALVVGGVGRLHHQKGWDILGRAAELVATRVPAARFVLVGEGPLRRRLETSFPALSFAGYHEEANRLAAAFDVVAAPSRYDAFGLAPVEAMAAGVPVVAAAVDALPEVVGPAAVLVPPEDVSALAAALVDLLQDPGRRRELGRTAQAWARERFSADRMVEETAAVFDAATATGSR